MKQQLHRLRGKPLLSLRPLTVSLLLSLAFVFHPVNSLDKVFEKESALGQTREERTQELEIGQDEPFDEPRLSLIEKHLKKASAQKLNKLSSQEPDDIRQISECPSQKILTGSTGFIRFPMMDDNYENNLRCSWRIVAPPGMVIRLEVRWHDFAGYDHCPTCCPDFLDIFDGRSESAPLVTKLCGETEDGAPPKIFRTTSSEALLVFVSDGKEGDDGFQLNYEIIPRNNVVSECPSLKTLTAPSGTIRFPMDGEYKNNLRCSWLIVAPPGMVIRLEVEWHDFANYDHCPTCCPDWLDIFDGRSENAPLMTKLCGETMDGAPPKMFRTTSSEALLVFVSDGKEGEDGFQLNYEIIPRLYAASEYD